MYRCSDGIREQNDQKIAELTEKYQDEFAKTQSSQICIQEQRQELDEARSELSKLTESVKRLDAELVGYRKERNDVIEERDTLMKRVDRQNFEVDRLEADIKALKQQVTSAINSKCEALSKYDEIQHKEANIAFKVSFKNISKHVTGILILILSILGKAYGTRQNLVTKSN